MPVAAEEPAAGLLVSYSTLALFASALRAEALPRASKHPAVVNSTAFGTRWARRAAVGSAYRGVTNRPPNATGATSSRNR